MNFVEYAETNYVNHEGFEIPRGFANGSKMNSVMGDRQDSLFSPLRTEFYSEAAMCVGAITSAINLSEINNNPDMSSSLLFAGSIALIGLGTAVRHSARTAVNNVVRKNRT